MPSVLSPGKRASGGVSHVPCGHGLKALGDHGVERPLLDPVEGFDEIRVVANGVGLLAVAEVVPSSTEERRHLPQRGSSGVSRVR